MATQSSILAWRIPWTEESWQAVVHGVVELDTTEVTEHTEQSSLEWNIWLSSEFFRDIYIYIYIYINH